MKAEELAGIIQEMHSESEDLRRMNTPVGFAAADMLDTWRREVYKAKEALGARELLFRHVRRVMDDALTAAHSQVKAGEDPGAAIREVRAALDKCLPLRQKD